METDAETEMQTTEWMDAGAYQNTSARAPAAEAYYDITATTKPHYSTPKPRRDQPTAAKNSASAGRGDIGPEGYLLPSMMVGGGAYEARGHPRYVSVHHDGVDGGYDASTFNGNVHYASYEFSTDAHVDDNAAFHRPAAGSKKPAQSTTDQLSIPSRDDHTSNPWLSQERFSKIRLLVLAAILLALVAAAVGVAGVVLALRAGSRATQAEENFSALLAAKSAAIAGAQTEAAGYANEAVMQERSRALAAESAEAVRAGGVEASLGMSVAGVMARATGIELSLSRALVSDESLSSSVANAVALSASISVSQAEERSRALNSEAALSAAVSNEAIRATGAEASISAALSGAISQDQLIKRTGDNYSVDFVCLGGGGGGGGFDGGPDSSPYGASGASGGIVFGTLLLPSGTLCTVLVGGGGAGGFGSVTSAIGGSGGLNGGGAGGSGGENGLSGSGGGGGGWSGILIGSNDIAIAGSYKLRPLKYFTSYYF